MKIKLYRSATVGIFDDDFKILTDPWLTDGEYYGSWSHYPRYNLKDNLKELNSFNAIYISHIHPDHCSTDTLKKLNKDIPVYISDYHSKFLKFKIEKLGFKVLELSNGKRHQLSKKTYLTIYPADNCNPKLCYKFNGCAQLNTNSNSSQQIDSLSVIDNGKFTILNVNDCPYDLSQHVIKTKVLKDFKKINLLLTGYGGAGAYPQCFENLSINEKKKESKKKQENFLTQSLNFIKLTKPEYYMPFAGKYVLSGKLNLLQDLRGVPSIDYTYEYLDDKIKLLDFRYTSKSIKLNTDEDFNFETKKYSNKYKKTDQKKLDYYQKNYLKNLRLDYENDEIISEKDLFVNAKKAMKNYVKKKEELNININSDIYIKLSKNLIKIPYNKNTIEIVERKKIDKSKKYVIYNLDLRLLNRILLGPKYAHWNNAEIGSHIKFFRSPNVFERNLYYSMNFFHA